METIVKNFNFIRNTYKDEELTREKIQVIFKGIPYGTTNNFIKTLLKYNILFIIKHNGARRYYKLTSKPIYIEKLRLVMNEVRASFKINKARPNPIEEAINLLKNNGYKIFKEV